MSKTVDDLAKVFRAALFQHLGNNPYATVGEGDRAGIIAVVTALRDEIESLPAERCRHREDINFLFYQILAPREGGQAAGGTRGERLATEDASPTCSTPAAPAPVCVWESDGTRGLDRLPHLGWNHPHGWTRGGKDGRKKCHHCGLPIKFTEAQR